MVNVIKASGESVPFDPGKIRKSLNRVGTDRNLIEQVVDEVSNELTEGMSTREIYRIAFRLLRKKSQALAAKYHLKRAIMQLGISGYPFEKYVAELLRHQGFQVKNNQMVRGYCVNHEVDVTARKNGKMLYVECKYHNRPGISCDVKVSLYFKARVLDIEKAHRHEASLNVEGWLITNTRFTDDALKYGTCAGLHLISWNYPQKGSLKDLIEISGLYPITCITNFTRAEVSRLMSNNIILCQSIHNHPALLDSLRIPGPRRESIIRQCHTLCQPT
ncbi:hypothetical protein AQUSIP_08350 [Aquicella siphonis]|uniref:ATP-cone domain-containing protein n=1 Tax=Aquicella siphonis TaxID=254247 RepID=A0A5E4PFY6_9COXI|nr:ATP cone domain-containing protein [Aquicella siphonis]VVC75545.1 hypothetical protein AQUSIP_08350 [Aquicella siphonis]